MAVVVTHDSREGLRNCLAAIERQDPPAAEILVVDNASRPPVADLVDAVPGATLVRQENLGPAGGHATGLERFRDADPSLRWAWVMDDDCVPEPHALGALLDAAGDDSRIGLAFPRALSVPAGEPIVGVGWCGVLIARDVVQTVGVPLRELFWWAEDTEYLQWRVPRAGFAVVSAEHAVVNVRTGRPSRAKPAWKYYYEARGTVFYRVRIQRSGPAPRGAVQITRRARAWRMTRSLVKLVGRALVVERDARLRKATWVARGAVDGALGRLGRRVAVDDAHRPG